MANLSEFKLILDRIDTATNQIAAELAALKTQIAGGGLDATAEAAVLASLDAAVKRLEGVGKEVIPPTA